MNIYHIENGPSRESLIDAFKYAYDKKNTISIEFLVPVGHAVDPETAETNVYIAMPLSDITIVSLEHEDGSGHQFNIRGYCKADLSGAFSSENAVLRSRKFLAYYNTRTRKGTISFKM